MTLVISYMRGFIYGTKNILREKPTNFQEMFV